MEVSMSPRNALKKANKESWWRVFCPMIWRSWNILLPVICPGFVAERRDMEEQDFSADVYGEVRQFALDSLKESVGTYDRVSVRRSDAQLRDEKWEYALLPVWTLTYHDQAKNEMYYFTVNGTNGKSLWKLPVD